MEAGAKRWKESEETWVRGITLQARRDERNRSRDGKG